MTTMPKLIPFRECFLVNGAVMTRNRLANDMLHMLRELDYQARYYRMIGVAVPHCYSEAEAIRFAKDSIRLDKGSGEAGIDLPPNYTGGRINEEDA